MELNWHKFLIIPNANSKFQATQQLQRVYFVFAPPYVLFVRVWIFIFPILFFFSVCRVNSRLDLKERNRNNWRGFLLNVKFFQSFSSFQTNASQVFCLCFFLYHVILLQLKNGLQPSDFIQPRCCIKLFDKYNFLQHRQQCNNKSKKNQQWLADEFICIQI